jgi:hypothetical protein
MKEKELPYSELTSDILGCCFEVMKELGPGFFERVYKNALLIAMRQKEGGPGFVRHAPELNLIIFISICYTSIIGQKRDL